MRKLLSIFLICFTTTTSAWNLPPSGSKMHIQYAGTINLNLPAQVYNVDLFDTTAAQIATLHANNKYVICYFSAGSWEDWRPDASDFPPAVIGKAMDGWAGERWLDVRAVSALIPIMTERMSLGVQKGCDAFDPDNVDGYTNSTGFKRTATDQKNYNTALTNVAHYTFGKAIGLKNTTDLVPDLVDFYDFTVNEQCHEYKECGTLKPFVDAGKPVYQIEYKGTLSSICKAANAAGRSTQKKKLSLNASGTQC